MDIQISIPTLVFYFFAVTLLFAATMVIISRNPVKSALFLVLAFVASTGLWLLLESEFLALVLIFVYVGAVMTLFLFVVMMINIDLAPLREGFVRYLPLGLLVLAVFVALIIFAMHPNYFANVPIQTTSPEKYSNVKELGSVLYTQYMYPFEIASALLLVAIIAAIALAHRGRQNSKSQNIAKQVEATKKNRLYLVRMAPKTNSEEKRQ